MAVKAYIRTAPGTRVSVNGQKREIIRSVGVGITSTGGAKNLAELNDVQVNELVDNATLVYDSGSEKYVVKTLPSLDGGSF